MWKKFKSNFKKVEIGVLETPRVECKSTSLPVSLYPQAWHSSSIVGLVRPYD